MQHPLTILLPDVFFAKNVNISVDKLIWKADWSKNTFLEVSTFFVDFVFLRFFIFNDLISNEV